jgi:hypothetical protein
MRRSAVSLALFLLSATAVSDEPSVGELEAKCEAARQAQQETTRRK